MKKYIFLSLFYFTANLAFSQARMVMNNNANLVINSSAFVVVDNSNSNAITLTGTGGGNIISEGENNRVRWRMGTSTGTYVVPFSKGSSKIPLSMNIGTAGVGNGYYDFSTYGTSTWNNLLEKPSMVTHMGQFNAPGAINHSEKAIDRFWLMNPGIYTTIPTSSFIFTYLDAEHTAPGNTITESDLGAQRFNTTTNVWGDMMPIGTLNTTNNTVSIPFMTPANFFAAWTLTQVGDPLSVELISFTANCVDQHVKLKWKTGSEQNSSHFQILQSSNMIDWEEIAEIPSHGNSSTSNTYEFQPENEIRATHYFQLVEHAMDETSKLLSTVSTTCEFTDNFDVSLYPNPNQGSFKIQVQSNEKMEQTLVQLFDLTGRILKTEVWTIEPGISEFSLSDLSLQAGSYVIKIDAKQKQAQVIRFVVN